VTAVVDQFILCGADPFSLLTHMSFYGLAAIAESQGLDLRMGWTTGMAPVPYLAGADGAVIAKAVRGHADIYTRDGSWLRETVAVPKPVKEDKQPKKDRQQTPPAAVIEPTGRQVPGQKDEQMHPHLFSPRIGKISDWGSYAASRHKALDRLISEQDWATLRFIWSLGEPCYWLIEKESPLQGDAASSFDMKPRNGGKGNDIIGRLQKLAPLIAKRPEQKIIEVLQSERVEDQENRPDSKSAMGFSGPGRVDDTVSWCALWGISQFALTQSAHTRARTSGYSPSGGVFYVPKWTGLWTPARLRSILGSGQLLAFATAAASASEQKAEVARKWLASRGAQTVFTFERKKSGGEYSPYNAQRGAFHHVG
jgi:CRISPR-associated protein Csb3